MDVVKDLKANDKWSLPKDWKAEANELRRIEADKIESDVLSDLKKEAGFLADDAEERAAIDRLSSTFDVIEKAEDTQNKKLLDGMLDQLDQNLGSDPELRKSFEAAVDYYNMSKGLGEKPDFRSVLESEMSDYYGRTNDIVRGAAEDMGQLTINQRT